MSTPADDDEPPWPGMWDSTEQPVQWWRPIHRLPDLSDYQEQT